MPISNNLRATELPSMPILSGTGAVCVQIELARRLICIHAYPFG